MKRIDPNSKLYQSLNPIQKCQVEHAQEVLTESWTAGLLSKAHLKGRALDFGCGLGGGALVLSYNGADVTAVDVDSKALEIFRRYNLIASDRIIEGDGVEYMQNLSENRLDLVTAFLLGPDFSGALTRSFCKEANRVIKPDGIILITSERETISNVEKNWPFEYRCGVSKDILVLFKVSLERGARPVLKTHANSKIPGL